MRKIDFMTNYLNYPFDAKLLIRKKRSIRRELLASSGNFEKKRVAILGGSSTHEVKDMMELFLLNYGIKATFYESDYGQYWEDAVFSNPKLDGFNPDFIYIHTTVRNIEKFPNAHDTRGSAKELLETSFNHFSQMWNALRKRYSCPIIQNNFELPEVRRLGNLDGVDYRGGIRFVRALNNLFAEFAEEHDGIYVNDINYLSSCLGLDVWFDDSAWYLYRYACSLTSFPTIGFNVANIIKSIIGKNKKCIVTDLDNPLWGGVIGDDGIEGIELSEGTPQGEAYRYYQEYLKCLSSIGVVLAVNSKNEEDIALSGLNHPDSILTKDDFAAFRANWNTKADNLQAIAYELNLGTDSFVFVDDNEAERDIVKVNVSGVDCVEFTQIEDVPRLIDRSGYFAITSLSGDDLARHNMYQANARRRKLESESVDFNSYLQSLEMTATIGAFIPLVIPRVTQLINKTNQFNLTTRRVLQDEVECWAEDDKAVTLYGALKDKYGDNGLVSALMGKISGDSLMIEIWVMSCRVFRRELEYAMMDSLVEICLKKELSSIVGKYIPTKKNGYVKDLYANLGFSYVGDTEDGGSLWKIDVPKYVRKNTTIKIKKA